MALPRKSDAGGWLVPAFTVAAVVTGLRLLLLAFNRTDLFVDESQYWLWGQQFAFGYYSKPPLIAWVIGASTWLSGQDSAFWIRAPFPLFHGATALILGALGARLYGPRVGVLAAAAYVTLPMTAVGSLLASTDTIMAPFFAAALWAHARLAATRAWPFALLVGAMAGLAFLAKYAAVYFLLGVGLGAVLLPVLRIGWGNAALLLAAFGAVIGPNLLWNLRNDFATMSHTMDNVGWLREAGPARSLNPAGMVEFFVSQFAVAGPVIFAALIVAAIRPRATGTARLLVFVLPAILVVCGQALMDRAYANWAASAYFAGTVAAVAVLAHRPRWLTASFVINGAICLTLPLLTLMPGLTLGRDAPLVSRYLGQSALSRQILAEARARGVPVVADRRDVLADLFFTGRDAGVMVFAPQWRGRPANHYEQAYPLPDAMTGQVLFVTATTPVCGGIPANPAVTFDTEGGTYSDIPLAGYMVSAECLHAP